MDVVEYKLPFIYQKKEYVATVQEFQPQAIPFVRASINNHTTNPKVFLFYRTKDPMKPLFWYYDERKVGMIEAIADAILIRDNQQKQIP